MPETWLNALKSYSYYVNLSDYEKANKFPNFFELEIEGDRESTIKFENYFQETAPNHKEPYYEVTFWKLYSQPPFRNKETNKVIRSFKEKEVKANEFWTKIEKFTNSPNRNYLSEIRDFLGISSPVLAVALTFPALANPDILPMVDSQVATWVNQNAEKHNEGRNKELTKFHMIDMSYTSLRDNDFTNYLNWVHWCQETAQILTEKTDLKWRPRDVEMAVFTAERENKDLNPL